METVLQHHIAVIRAQASILHRELKENRNRLCQDQALVQGQSQGQGQVKNPESTVVLPPSIQRRKPPAESIHTVRLIDNFEMTVMYLLDADGMIQEKNRLEYLMILMSNTLEDHIDRRVLCLHLLIYCTTDAMKACFMDSGGIRLIELWIKDIADIKDEITQYAGYMLMVVRLLHNLPAIALKERNCSKMFFDNALMPLAKSARLKGLKSVSEFNTEYKLLKNEYARVRIDICDLEEREGEQRAKEKAEEEEKAVLVRQLEVEADDIPVEISLLPDEEMCVESSHHTDYSEASVHQDKEEDVSEQSGSNSILSNAGGGGSNLSDSAITDFATFASTMQSSRQTPSHSTYSGLEALDPSLLSVNRISSTSSSPRHSTNSPPEMLPTLPELPVFSLYDYRTEKKPFKSILKKSIDLVNFNSSDIRKVDLTPLPKSTKRGISFSNSEKLRNTCPWYGGMDCYYRWAKPCERDSSSLEQQRVDSSEANLQEKRMIGAKEFRIFGDYPDDPSFDLDQDRNVSSRPVATAKVVPWMWSDNAEAEAVNRAEDDDDDDDVAMDDVSDGGVESNDPLEAFGIETTAPDLNQLLKNDSHNIYIAIWDFVDEYIGYPEETHSSLLYPRGRLSVSLNVIGTELSSKFGSKYLSKCPGQNLKRVLLAHPEGKFSIHEKRQFPYVSLNIVLSDIWKGLRSICDKNSEKVHLLSEVECHIVSLFGTQYLGFIAKDSLSEVVMSHPANLFDLYEVIEADSRKTALRVRVTDKVVDEPSGAELLNLTSTASNSVVEGRLEEIHEEHIDNDVYDVEHEVGNDDHSNVIDLSHISKCFKNGSDPYLNPCDSDDETESTCSSPSVAPRVINDRSGSSRDVDVFGDKFLRAVLLNTFVEHIKERGITGCRKSQINASLVQLYNRVISRAGYSELQQSDAVGRKALLHEVTNRFSNIYVQEQHPSSNHCVYYIDNPCVNAHNWKKEVTCLYLPLVTNGRRCKNGRCCEFVHRKVYDEHERGFSDSTTKRNISTEVLRKQILSVVKESDGVVFNHEVFERYYKKFGCRLCLGSRETICTEAKALDKLLGECPEVQSFSDPRCTGFKVMAYSYVVDNATTFKRKRKEDVEIDEDAEVMSRCRDKLYTLIKESGKCGVRLDDISRKYYEMYGEHCRFTVHGEIELDLGSIIETIPGVRKDMQSLEEDDIEDFRRSSELFPSGGAWGSQSSSNIATGDTNKHGKGGNGSVVYYFDESKSYLDEEGCLDVNAVGKMSKGDNYHVKRIKRQAQSEYKQNYDRTKTASQGRSRSYSPRKSSRSESRRVSLSDRRERYDTSARSSEVESSRSRNVVITSNTDSISPPRRSRASGKHVSVCLYYNTPRGCYKGNDCPYQH